MILLKKANVGLGFSQLPSAIKLATAWLVLLLTTYVLWNARPDVQQFVNGSAGNVYAFYAHNDVYACSVAINAHILQRDLGTKYRIIAILSDQVSSEMRDALEAQNVVIVPDDPLPLPSGSAERYDGCLLKLAAFKLHRYDPSIQRVLMLDADQLILQDIDYIFKTNPSAEFLAPTAYWLGNRTISSTFMLIRPSDAAWERIESHAANITDTNTYDMDLINEIYVKDENEERLPSKFVTLNSHWEDWSLPSWFESAEPRSPGADVTTQEMHDLQDQTPIIHFTAVAKPWERTTAQLQKDRPTVHPLFVQQWVSWRSSAAQLCPAFWEKRGI